MNDLIAKKYAKAIILTGDMKDFYKNLQILNEAFSLTQFKILMQANQVKKEKKMELLSLFFNKTSPKFMNFLKLLVKNSRISCIPQILKELEREKSFKEGIYLGVIYTKEKLKRDNIKNLESKLSDKFNVKIKLQNQLSQDNGVKITLEELGYEISFSMDTLQSRMSEFILRII